MAHTTGNIWDSQKSESSRSHSNTPRKNNVTLMKIPELLWGEVERGAPVLNTV
jgi:hypothetical protein